MFTTLGLDMAQYAINHLFADLTDADKAPLVGKVLRVSVGTVVFLPVVVDVVFDVDKVRFEPTPNANSPDCVLGCETPKALIMHLNGTDIGSTSGDTTLIDHVRHIIKTHPNSQALMGRFYGR